MLLSEALEGKYVKTTRNLRRGIIQSAEPRNNVGTNDNEYAYVCRIRPESYPLREDFYSTIYVKAGE